jgi:hypothetical protein
VDLERPLRDRLEEGDEVDLLERFAVDDRVVDLADDGEHGDRLAGGVVHGDDQVRRARPARDQAGGQPARGAREAVGHVPRGLRRTDTKRMSGSRSSASSRCSVVVPARPNRCVMPSRRSAWIAASPA